MPPKRLRREHTPPIIPRTSYFSWITTTSMHHDSVAFVSLTCTNQRNSVCCKVIVGSPDYCSVQCTVHRVKALRLQDAVGRTPLASYHLASGKWSGVSPANVITAPRTWYRFPPERLQCKRPTGRRQILLGRSRSDVMFRYLHVSWPRRPTIAHLWPRRSRFRNFANPQAFLPLSPMYCRHHHQP